MNREGIKNWNQEDRDQLAAELESIMEEMRDLNDKAAGLVREQWSEEIAHANAYVFGQIAEHIENANPHNSSYFSLTATLRGDDEASCEPIASFGESWEDDE